ncbi:MAG: polyhydroxyalkanoic acid system family protein [Myxococcales bacterium]|nr:polyhydroxyalkanoic acid system family protein [Myxococcales bacterium]
MAAIDITKNHTLGKDTARTKANEVIDRIKGEYGIQGSWNGDVFTITKPTEGRFTVTDTTVRCEIELSFMMRALKGKIEEKVKSELQRALG